MAGSGAQEAEQLFRQGLARLRLALPETQVAQLVRYSLELEKWNRKVNLLAKDTPLFEIVDKHFLDSLTLVPLLDQLSAAGATLLDVGSGAGFPGLAVKLARPGWQVTLLEPREKRSIFLRHIIRTLQLDGVRVESSRIEEGRLPAGFAVITGRAVADVPSFLAMVEALAVPATSVICMQGEGGRGELAAGDRVGVFTCAGVEEMQLPLSRDQRYLLQFRRG